MYVGPSDEIVYFAGLALNVLDGGLDELDETVDGARERVVLLDVFHCRLDGAAVGVS